MSLNKILMDDRLTREQTNAMLKLLQEVGEGFISKVLEENRKAEEASREQEDTPIISLEGRKLVTAEDCKPCEHSVTCPFPMLMENFWTLEGIVWDKKGCPRDWKLDEEKEETEEESEPTAASPAL
jgi:hypothetical protein